VLKLIQGELVMNYGSVCIEVGIALAVNNHSNSQVEKNEVCGERGMEF